MVEYPEFQIPEIQISEIQISEIQIPEFQNNTPNHKKKIPQEIPTIRGEGLYLPIGVTEVMCPETRHSDSRKIYGNALDGDTRHAVS